MNINQKDELDTKIVNDTVTMILRSNTKVEEMESPFHFTSHFLTDFKSQIQS